MLPNKKRRALTVEEKIGLVKEIEQGTKQCVIAHRLGLSQSTVNCIWKQKRKWLDTPPLNGNKIRMRRPQYEDVDHSTLLWFQEQMSMHHVQPTGPMIRKRAELFAIQYGIKEFKASNGWLSRWKQRHNISHSQNNSSHDYESAVVDEKIPDEFLEKVWPVVKARYDPEQIYSAHETGLFYKISPNEATRFQSELCVNGELSGERVTVLVAANMTGSMKRRLIVIGKFETPVSFRNVKYVPVDYKSNKNAWMTPQIFEEEIRQWDCELDGEKILLLVGNCASHPPITNLQNIELCYLPERSQQPMGSVIKSLKSFYRRRFLMEYVESMGHFRPNLLKATQMISRAWLEVSENTVRQSFKNAGLVDDRLMVAQDEDFSPLAVWGEQFELPFMYTPDVLQDYENVDEAVATTAPENSPKAVNVNGSEDLRGGSPSRDKIESSEEDTEQPEPVPTPQQALEAAKVLHRFFTHHDEGPMSTEVISVFENKLRSLVWKTKDNDQN
ncbi:tigger transposable element-derived protein 4 isoform X1 [Nilaparvata lugens]|uniref:tigger transposable element-derived protein 4 isoform X1 n=1 Tax=Nilaparvata lugens TaxID=108931 RepID=UPI00193E5631|nr:tigger transposable element-derived protein 4 isoform X1 [Nilaparvata lugens]XP_039292049.1 tigger transposable element-derived protein 4 isoform X1 [Nilaparvata lugens]XP_039292050.1 tigger transposable element-derived protein 4 isoform X1 [Nilaparvata lugens]XP_039292051.1 tigger transposable element-derived protein 4 isoform X1 [Nilaparvata lugens]